MSKIKDTITVDEFREIQGWKQKPSKYRNKKVKWQGKTFDSKKEFEYYLKLSDDKKRGKIADFTWQRPLIFRLGNKKMFTLIIDFVVFPLGDVDKLEYIDVKAWDKKSSKFLTTPLFNLKRKLIEAQHGIKIILE